MNILFIGDIFAKPGRRALKELLPSIKKKHEIDLVIANGENASGGVGINEKCYREILKYGVDVITTGNHVYKHKDIYPILRKEESKIIRPVNYPIDDPGKGYIILENKVAIVNLAGRLFLKEKCECPFRVIDRTLVEIKQQAKIIIVDIHAEATAEKRALGWYLDGRVSAVIGSHTHIQTADEQILPEGTAYITDVGMTGAHESVIGIEKDLAIKKFLTDTKVEFKPSKKDVRLQGVVVEIDEGKVVSIERVEEMQRVHGT